MWNAQRIYQLWFINDVTVQFTFNSLYFITNEIIFNQKDCHTHFRVVYIMSNWSINKQGIWEIMYIFMKIFIENLQQSQNI
jgi:hypothetical protein